MSECLQSIVGNKLVSEIAEKWRILSDKVEALAYDPDVRVASVCRQFLQLTVNASVITSASVV